MIADFLTIAWLSFLGNGFLESCRSQLELLFLCSLRCRFDWWGEAISTEFDLRLVPDVEGDGMLGERSFSLL